MQNLFCFGFGYSARALARDLETRDDVTITGTTRSQERIDALGCTRRTIFAIDPETRDARVAQALQSATHVLVSASPDEGGDPLLRIYGDDLNLAKSIRWVGYLSTIGVYGDQGNAWVDEDTPPAPGSERARRRVTAEQAWLAFGSKTGVRVQVFRLAGIYGPGRSVIDKLKTGTARRIEKPGQVFNRIHVADIALVVAAAMNGAGRHVIYNVTDDEPAPPQDVVAHGARLLGMEPPPLIPIDDANLSPMGRSFYAEQRRVRNARMKSDLGVQLRYPTYREGLAAIVDHAESL